VNNIFFGWERLTKMQTNARFFLRLFAISAFAVQLFGQSAPVNLFNGREVIPPPPGPARHWKGTAINTNYYSKINPGRSLLLYDCGANSPWCNDKQFAFTAIFSKASKRLDPNPDAAAAAWFKSAAKLNGFNGEVAPWKGAPLSKNSFQVLAIVNRLDLAQWTTGKWTGAELRFVFGPKPNNNSEGQPPQLTLIVEFTLPPMEGKVFRALAQDWLDLSAPGAPIPAKLAAAVADSQLDQSPLVRLRLNHLTNTGPWQLAEWDLGPQQTQVVSCGQSSQASAQSTTPVSSIAPLKDQIKLSAAHQGNPDYDSYKQLWAIVPLVTNSQSIQVPDCLDDPQPRCYTMQTNSMSTLVGVCAANAETRKILALQQCSFCHSAESGTAFVHIANRLPAQNSRLSGFLLGGAAQNAPVLPDLDALYAGDPSTVFTVPISYQTYTGASPPCVTPVASNTTRRFNDFARRALFLSAVLLAPDDPDPASIATINAFGTNYAH
jgi:hypothetical protein